MSPKLLRFLDTYLLGLLVSLLSLRSQPALRAKPARIIAIKLGGIGEAVLTLPALKALAGRPAWPGGRRPVTILCSPSVAPVYQGQPGLEVQVLSLLPQNLFMTIARQWRAHDVAIDLEPYAYLGTILAWALGRQSIGFATRRRGQAYTTAVLYNAEQHVVQTYADLLQPLIGYRQIVTLTPLAANDLDRQRVGELLAKKKLTAPLVCVAPSVGRSAKLRQWPIERFASVADSLAKLGFHILWVGTAADQRLLSHGRTLMRHKSNTVTSLSLSEVAQLVRQAALVIANDSGLMHIGAAMGTATLGLFGSNLPVRFKPLNPLSRFLFHSSPCSPHINVHRGEIDEGDCTCIKQISTAEVLATCRDMLRA